MVSGKPYISVNSAPMKALYTPKERPSRRRNGVRKLMTKSTKKAALNATSDQKPYPYGMFSPCMVCSVLRTDDRSRLRHHLRHVAGGLHEFPANVPEPGKVERQAYPEEL